MESKIWYLKHADPFSWMNEEQLNELAGISRMEQCAKEHRFYWTDELSDTVYLIKEGRIKLSRTSPEGREVTLDLLGPGEIFGELSLTGEEQRNHTAEAVEPSLVCAFSRKQFTGVLQRHPEMAFRIIKLIGFRFRELESRLEDLAFQSVAQRVRGTLRRLAAKHGIPAPDRVIRLPITQKDLAFLIGASREAVAEELAHLKQQGFLQTSYRCILLQPQLFSESDL